MDMGVDEAGQQIRLARVFIAHTRLTDAVMAGAVYAGHFPDKKSAIITRDGRRRSFFSMAKV